MTLVKICGICSADDARVAVEEGADLLGFHFCSSLRRMTPDAAREIIAAIPRRPTIVGVFIDEPEVETARIAEYCRLDLLQLHGSERPGYRANRPLMKVLKVRNGELPDAGEWPDPIMLDSWTADQRGGSGLSWPWESARALVAQREVFIAGGLRPDNVGDVVTRFRPHGVDVSSGVEREPRRKDHDAVRRFIEAVREADAELGSR